MHHLLLTSTDWQQSLPFPRSITGSPIASIARPLSDLLPPNHRRRRAVRLPGGGWPPAVGRAAGGRAGTGVRQLPRPADRRTGGVPYFRERRMAQGKAVGRRAPPPIGSFLQLPADRRAGTVRKLSEPLDTFTATLQTAALEARQCGQQGAKTEDGGNQGEASVSARGGAAAAAAGANPVRGAVAQLRHTGAGWVCRCATCAGESFRAP